MKKTALIIGATGGIGSALTRTLLQAGYTVYGTYYRNEEMAQELASKTNCRMLSCNLQQSSSIENVFRELTAKEEKLDIFVNASIAGFKLKKFDELTPEEISQEIDTNFKGHLLCLRGATSFMKQKKQGTAVEILTHGLETLPPRLSTYLAMKSGLKTFIQCLAPELAPFGVRILGLSPSFVETSLLKAFPTKLLEIEKEKRSGHGFLTPQNIADILMEMIEKPDQYKTGQTVNLEHPQ